MAQEAQQSREERERAWWVAWRAEDYSWDGLAQRAWAGWSVIIATGEVVETEDASEGARPATLQDYWRRDPATGRLRDDAAMAAELIRADGQPAYHIAHCPLAYADGTPTVKAGWGARERAALHALFSAQLGAAAETAFEGEWYDREPIGADRRAQLDGAVLFQAPVHLQGKASPLHLCARRTAWAGEADFAGARFGGDAAFDSATFSGYARFKSATFSGDASFFSATFSGDASFNSATFSGYARFDSATFSGYASFDSATFSGNASFKSATFSGDASFYSATFSGDASFFSATFSGDASFDSATFSGDARFNSATFSGDASFFSATFSGDASFFSATFSGDANFFSATFSGNASFMDATFEGQARLQVKAFEKQARFDRCQFRQIVWFDGAAFKGDMDFTVAVFERLASFENIKWPEAAGDWHAAFDQALFQGAAAFTGAGFKAFAAFDGATFERGVQMDDVDEREADRAFTRERAAIRPAAARHAQAWAKGEKQRRDRADKEHAKPVTRAETHRQELAARETRLQQLERGCRVLKQAMDYASDKTRAQLLFRYELLARRAQADTPLGEKLFSHLYAWTSDYGASIARPVLWLIATIAAFAALYWGGAWALAQWVAPADPAPRYVVGAAWSDDLFESLSFSWNNVFRPLSALSAEALQSDDRNFEAQLLYGYPPWVGFAVRLVATLQSLFAIVLAFLFALAVRRRFQIS